MRSLDPANPGSAQGLPIDMKASTEKPALRFCSQPLRLAYMTTARWHSLAEDFLLIAVSIQNGQQPETHETTFESDKYSLYRKQFI